MDNEPAMSQVDLGGFSLRHSAVTDITNRSVGSDGEEVYIVLRLYYFFQRG